MLRRVESGISRWPLARPFRISRGVRTVAEVVTVILEQDGVSGRGECVPYPRYGESCESVLAQIAAAEGAVADGASRDALQAALPAGAARNALDCALWDLDMRLGLADPGRGEPVQTALTVGIDTPERMAAEAARQNGSLLKVKLDADDAQPRLEAVRAARPDARLIVDPNESWSMSRLEDLQPVLARLRVEFVEQPLPAAEDGALKGFAPLVPICADESCHVAGDLGTLRAKYQMVNIKLDKTGGLTEALRLLESARALDFGIMVGCMICTSLSIAPALRIAGRADYADLDGPLWLKEDRAGGVSLRDGVLMPPAAGFWAD